MKKRHVPCLREGIREYPIYFDKQAYDELVEFIEGGEEYDETHPRVLAVLESDPGNRIVIHPLLRNCPNLVLNSVLHEALHICERRIGAHFDPDPEKNELLTEAFSMALSDILAQSGIVDLEEIEFGTLVLRDEPDEE